LQIAGISLAGDKSPTTYIPCSIEAKAHIFRSSQAGEIHRHRNIQIKDIHVLFTSRLFFFSQPIRNSLILNNLECNLHPQVETLKRFHALSYPLFEAIQPVPFQIP
jgi:hypothetical protein